MNRDTSTHSLLPLSHTHTCMDTHIWNISTCTFVHTHVCVFIQASQEHVINAHPSVCVCMDKTGVGPCISNCRLPPTDGSDQHLKSEEGKHAVQGPWATLVHAVRVLCGCGQVALLTCGR